MRAIAAPYFGEVQRGKKRRLTEEQARSRAECPDLVLKGESKSLEKVEMAATAGEVGGKIWVMLIRGNQVTNQRARRGAQKSTVRRDITTHGGKKALIALQKRR